MIVHDNVRFLMPKDREYQFAALAVVQTFINGYPERSKAANKSTGSEAEHKLHYQLAMSTEALNLFLEFGLVLEQLPEPLDSISMEVDLTEERLNKFRQGGRHLTQVCGQMCGVLCRALPVIRYIALRTLDWKWLHDPTLQDLRELQPNQVTGVIGRRGLETYIAAAMGLAVVELVTPGQAPMNWLTKWQNKFYCIVELSETDDMTAVMVRRAQDSVERALTTLVQDKLEKQQAESPVQLFDNSVPKENLVI